MTARPLADTAPALAAFVRTALATEAEAVLAAWSAAVERDHAGPGAAAWRAGPGWRRCSWGWPRGAGQPLLV